MSIAQTRRDRLLLLAAFGVVGAGLVLGVVLGASRLALYVPPASSGSPAEALGILTNNLEILALLAIAALLQPRGVPGLSPGFLPLWLADAAVGLVVFFNLVALGAALGALGPRVLVRVMPHAPLEVGGYLVAVIVYLRARDGSLERGYAISRLALAAALLAIGAFVESYISGTLA